MKKNPVNIFDVARLAGVSIATVSRALTSPHKLKPDTLRRVQNAVNKLGYVSHGVARALASRRTYTIGAVFPSLDSIFADTTYALQKRLDEQGYMLVVSCNEYDPRTEVRLVRNLIERGVDGLVLVGTTHDPDFFSLVKAFQLPYVLTWATDPTGQLPCVGFNNRLATSLVTQHLIDLGHRHFAMISGITAHNERVRERVAGVTETLARNRLALSDSQLVEAHFSFAAGRQAMKKLLSNRRRPTAVVCSNDVLAVGALAECHAQGMAVPGDISIAGCGDFDIASMVTPALTTVRWPTKDLGEHAATYLLKKLSGEPMPLQQEFSVELMIRETTSAPAKKQRILRG